MGLPWLYQRSCEVAQQQNLRVPGEAVYEATKGEGSCRENLPQGYRRQVDEMQFQRERNPGFRRAVRLSQKILFFFWVFQLENSSLLCTLYLSHNPFINWTAPLTFSFSGQKGLLLHVLGNWYFWMVIKFVLVNCYRIPWITEIIKWSSIFCTHLCWFWHALAACKTSLVQLWCASRGNQTSLLWQQNLTKMSQ